MGSSSTSISASVAATPKCCKAFNVASSTVFPVVSTQSTGYRSFLGRLSFERGCWAGGLGVGVPAWGRGLVAPGFFGAGMARLAGGSGGSGASRAGITRSFWA